MKTAKKQRVLSRRRFLSHAVAGSATVSLGLMGFPSIAMAKKSLTIGYIPILDHLVLVLSHAREHRLNQGFDITPRLFKSWRSIAGALEAGVLDGAFLLSNYAMDLFHRGAPIQSILVGHRHGSGMVVRADSSIEGPKDLAGKTVAVPAKISTHTALLDTYLRSAGLSLSHITVREIAPSHMLTSMQHGSTDAFIVAEPFCAMAEREGVGRIMTFSKDILANHVCCILVMRREVLAANREGIQMWVNSLVRTGQWIDQQKTEQKAGEVARLATGYMPHSEQVILAGLVAPNDRVLYTDLNPRRADYQAIVDISRRAGLIQPVDMKSFIDHTFFENVIA